MNALASRGAALLGAGLQSVTRLAGGDLSDVLLIRLDDGREAVVKGGPAPLVEAAMLRAIAAAGAPAPAVLAVDREALVLELLPSGGSLAAAGVSLGQALRRLHAATGDAFGWPDDYAFARVAILNRAADDWPGFWAARRILPMVPHVPADLGRRLAALAERLPDRLPRRPSASLLHGDLWAGNVLASGGRVTGLIDPACYFGHSEVDLAMLHLFGGPGHAFREAYGPAAPGENERRPVYQLWPALVHLRLFGGSYRPLVERLLAESAA